MNRMEYMERLAALLQDVPVRERVAAMRYYNDYFDDAGEENEGKVMEELGSPEQVAAEVKAGLGKQPGESGEFRETGYTDTRFERKDVPVRHAGEESKPWTSKSLKVALLILILFFALPILAPLAFACVGVAIALAVVLVVVPFGIFIALAAVAAALVIIGIAVFVKGMFLIVINPAVSLGMMGAGMVLTVLGVLALVGAVRLCVIVFPGLIRFFAHLCERIFRIFERRKERA